METRATKKAILAAIDQADWIGPDEDGMVHITYGRCEYAIFPKALPAFRERVSKLWLGRSKLRADSSGCLVNPHSEKMRNRPTWPPYSTASR